MKAHPSTDHHDCCAVVELRQYTLKPGQRDVLIDLFDRYFVEGQELTGMTVIGQFRDRRHPERFVWLRGFPNMEQRHQALAAFYGGPVWGAHRERANGTMIDWNDVLLLKPARPDTSIRIQSDRRGADRKAAGLTVLIGIHQLPQPASTTPISQFESDVAPVLRANDIQIDGVFVTEPAHNTFDSLPVREGEHVLVWCGTVESGNGAGHWPERLADIVDFADGRLTLLELEPTPRSALGHGPLAARGSKHDFDFLFGCWKVHNRYLKSRLCQSNEWTEFRAALETQPVLNGLGNVDQYFAQRDGEAIYGVTLRLFNPATGEWSIHWADNVRAGILLPPMVGRFNGDVGEFFGDEIVGGRTVRCRFLWTRTKPDSPQWSQAFSGDGGETWETNWIMTFTREK